MDAATSAAARLHEHRAADLDREIAHLVLQAKRRAALGDLTPQPLRPRSWSRFSLRRRAKARREAAAFALAGPSS